MNIHKINEALLQVPYGERLVIVCEALDAAAEDEPRILPVATSLHEQALARQRGRGVKHPVFGKRVALELLAAIGYLLHDRDIGNP